SGTQPQRIQAGTDSGVAQAGHHADQRDNDQRLEQRDAALTVAHALLRGVSALVPTPRLWGGEQASRRVSTQHAGVPAPHHLLIAPANNVRIRPIPARLAVSPERDDVGILAVVAR